MYGNASLATAVNQINGEPREKARRRIAELNRWDRLIPSASARQALLESLIWQALGTVDCRASFRCVVEVAVTPQFLQQCHAEALSGAPSGEGFRVGRSGWHGTHVLGSAVLGLAAVEDAEQGCGDDACAAADAQYAARELPAANKVVALRPGEPEGPGGVFDAAGSAPGGADLLGAVLGVRIRYRVVLAVHV
ncbi:hypothetical protein [Streptomyces crystallinus]|uniref:Uncharacterized protein n=1 Tax=Streptomyces crystallinus TaxID=68191 RepID=A0ABN1H554_9ACTN